VLPWHLPLPHNNGRHPAAGFIVRSAAALANQPGGFCDTVTAGHSKPGSAAA